MPYTIDAFVPGEQVVVTQQIPQRDEVWVTKITGRVVRAQQVKTGSWFARNRDAKLWLDRLVLQKDDGELVVINLDGYTHVEKVPVAASPQPDRFEPGAGATEAVDDAGASPKSGSDGSAAADEDTRADAA